MSHARGLSRLKPSVQFLFISIALLFIATPIHQVHPSGEISSSNQNHCRGEMTVPIRIAIDTERMTPQARGTATLQGSVSLDADVPSLVLRYEGDGVAQVSASPASLGSASAGDELEFSFPVYFADDGRAQVHVWAEARDEFGDLLYSRRETLYVLLRPDQSFVGLGGFQAVDLDAIEHDFVRGTLSTEQAEKAREDLAKMDAVVERGVESGLGGTITVQGNILWTDENGDTHATYKMRVEIWDDDIIFDDLVATTETDMNGDYSVVVDNDDGFGEGDRDIYVRVETTNGFVDCQTLGGDTYFAESGVTDEVPSGSTVTENFVFTNMGNNPALSVFQAGTWIGEYTEDVNGSALGQVDVVWPNGDTGSFYNGQVQIEEPDRWDWDTIHHEYGHYVMDELNIEQNPGGAHGIGDCISDVRGEKNEGNRLAWGEGWPTYFGTSGQVELNLASLNVPRVGDTLYEDLEDGSLSYNLETQSGIGVGEDNEVAVQRLLWDLYDTNLGLPRRHLTDRQRHLERDRGRRGKPSHLLQLLVGASFGSDERGRSADGRDRDRSCDRTRTDLTDRGIHRNPIEQDVLVGPQRRMSRQLRWGRLRPGVLQLGDVREDPDDRGSRDNFVRAHRRRARDAHRRDP